MRTVNYNKMVNYNVSIPEGDVPMFESLFKKYNVIVEPTIVAEPVEEHIPNKETIKAIEEGRIELAKYKKGLVKGYTNAQELINDILSEEDE